MIPTICPACKQTICINNDHEMFSCSCRDFWYRKDIFLQTRINDAYFYLSLAHLRIQIYLDNKKELSIDGSIEMNLTSLEGVARFNRELEKLLLLV